MSKSAVAKQEEYLPAIPMADLERDAGAGSEEVGAADVQIPTLVVLQALSPQLEAGHAAYIPEAKAGMVCDTLTGQLWDGSEGVSVIPVHFRPVVNQMKIVGSKGEFVAEFPVTDPFAKQHTERDDQKRDRILGTDEYLMQVAQHFVIVKDTAQPAVIRMKRTGIRPSRRWNAILEQYKPLEVDGRRVSRPRFSIECVLKTAREEKDGNTWFNWAPEIVGEVSDVGLYEMGRDLHAMLKSGIAVAAPEPQETEASF